MPREFRADGQLAWHHAINFGAGRETIFPSIAHGQAFLALLGELCGRAHVEVHAYALMPSHYHLLVRAAAEELSEGIRHLEGAYCRRFDGLCNGEGPLFAAQRTEQVVSRADHLRHVTAHLHLNPVKAGQVALPDESSATSYRAYMGLVTPPEWLTLDDVLDVHGGPQGLSRFTRALQRGTSPWPPWIDRESGLLNIR